MGILPIQWQCIYYGDAIDIGLLTLSFLVIALAIEDITKKWEEHPFLTMSSTAKR